MNEEELIQKTRKLISRWDNVRVVGLGWSGDPRRGFQFNPTDVRTGGGGSGGTPPPPTTSGACCPTEGDCFISTQTICEDGGGTYQGDGTTCDPDPCPTMPPCNGCGFFNPDDGKTYLTKTYSYSEDTSACIADGTCCSTIGCPTGQYILWYESSETVSELASEHYEEDCSVTQTFGDISRTVNCFCDCGSVGGCPPSFCDALCTGCHTDPNTNPEFWAFCGTLNTTITYSDECTPP